MAYNYITNFDSPNYTPAAQTPSAYGMSRVIEGITIHWWGDPNLNPSFEGVVNYLCRPNGNSSAHFVVTGTDRRVACIVNPGDTAWHSGNAWGNARTIGLELDPRARPEDYDVAAELIADIRSAYGDVPIYWHSYFSSTSCPGVYDVNRLDEMSYAKYSHATEWGQGGNRETPAPTPTPTPEPVEPPATVVLFKLLVDGKQVAAYSTEANAYRGYVQYGSKGKITLNGKDVTADLIKMFTAPSPTAEKDPETGVPTIERADFDNLVARVSTLEQFMNALKGVFK